MKLNNQNIESSNSLDNQHTIPMKVDNLGFLLDRLGADCGPLQFLRELTVNSIEAIQNTPEKNGQIFWEFDPMQLDLVGAYKLCIIDTGSGMTGPEMVKYINHLSSSGHEQSVEGNFGVGAKISAATRNHAGVIYLSWKEGRGAMIHLWRNPENGTYGLRPLKLINGSYSSWAPITEKVKPKQIDKNGTVVILLGDSEDADTMSAPPGSSSPSRWIARYLNSRFFEFPEGIAVRAREGWTSESPDTNVLRTVKGSKEFLERHKESSGEVDLGSATALWWILKESPAVSQSSGANVPGGHVAALHQNELYELHSGRSGTILLQKFGVLVGHKRVVLYIQPNAAENSVTANTARTMLMINGEALPWVDWAESFRDQFPQEIRDLINSIVENEPESDHEKSIKDRLREIADLYRLKKYRPSAEGKARIRETTDTGEAKSPSQRSRGSDSRTAGAAAGSSNNRSTRSSGDIYTLFLEDEGTAGVEIPDNFDVSVRWVPEDELPTQDRAAHYVPERRTLLINQDFRVFNGFIERWEERYRSIPEAIAVITPTVREWFEQSLREVVYGAEHLRGDMQWTDESMEVLLSDEALTAAVLPRYHTEMAVRKALGIKLGSLKERSVA